MEDEKEKKIVLQTWEPTLTTAKEVGMPIDQKFYRSRLHLVDLEKKPTGIELDIGPVRLLYVQPGSMVAMDNTVYLSGGLHPHECESKEYLKLGPNPHVTYPNFHFGLSSLELIPKRSKSRVWHHNPPPIDDSISKNCVAYLGKLYTFGSAFLQPEVFNPHVNRWKKLPGPGKHSRCRVPNFPLSDPSSRRIFVPVLDVQLSSTVLYALSPPTTDGNGGWDLISKDIKYWTDIAAVVDNVIYFHSHGFPCLLRAYDVTDRTWLKVGWHSCFGDDLDLNYEKFQFRALLNLGSGKLCFVRDWPLIYRSFQKCLVPELDGDFRPYLDSFLAGERELFLADTFFLKFQVKRSGTTVNLIPISSHRCTTPNTGSMHLFATV